MCQQVLKKYQSFKLIYKKTLRIQGKDLLASNMQLNESINADIATGPVYHSKLSTNIVEGYTCFITGFLSSFGDRYIIDFATDNLCKDITVRLGVRNSTRTLGINSRIKRSWGTQETCVFKPFRSRSIDIQVCFTAGHIYIAFEGVHVAKYIPRLPITAMRSLEIRGDLMGITIQHNTLTAYPLQCRGTPHIGNIRDPSAETADVADVELEQEAAASSAGNRYLPSPYYATLGQNFFKEGYILLITGQIRRLPNTFKVALQLGQAVWPQPQVALQLEFRFTDQNGDKISKPIIAVNSFSANKWSDETKTELKDELRSEANITLAIVHRKDAFEIDLNNERICNYPYVASPLHVNTCFIEGDINLTDVVISFD